MPAQPRVGIVRHQPFRPSETFIVNQAMALRSFRPLFVARDRVTRPGVDSVSVADHGRRAVLSYTLNRASGPLRADLEKWDVVLLHAHFGVEGSYVAPLAKELGVPLVTTLHGFDVSVTTAQLLSSRKPSWINYVRWRGSLFAQGAVFIAVSDHIRRRAIEWGYPAEKVVTLPIGVDLDRILPAEPVEVPRIVHVARLVEKKGTADLLRALAVVRRAVPGAELVIVGDGPLRESLGELAAELGVAEGVRFLGALPHPEVVEVVRQSRVLCLPSVTAASGDQEGLPTVLMEGSAAGKPVVATYHGGIPEAVVDGQTGFLVAERDSAALAERLIELLRDPQMCERFGKAGREMMLERFNLRRQTDKLESLYGGLR